MESILGNMIDALGLEVEAIKKRGGSHSIEVRGGERRGMVEGNVLYAFALTEQIYLRDDSPIRVIAGKEEVDGVVLSLGDQLLLVALERDLGPKIPFARLISDDSFLIERLKDKLEVVVRKEVSFNHLKADQTIGVRRSGSGKVEVEPRLTREGRRSLDSEQVTAIATALGSGLSYIWGPPGTGKTTVLASIVEGFYRRGLSVLVVSNTNVAVDTALQKIADRLRSAKDKGYERGTVLRYGPIVKPELKQEKYTEKVCIDKVVARLGRKLQAEKQSLEADRAKQEVKAAPLRRWMRELQEFDEAQHRVTRLQPSVRQAAQKQEAAQSIAAATMEKIGLLRSQLERARQMGSLRRFLSGLNPKRLTDSMSKAQVELAAQHDRFSALANEKTEVEADLRKSQDVVKNLRGRLSEIIRCPSCHSQNRVCPFGRGKRPVCGRCKNKLSLVRLHLRLEDRKQMLQRCEKKIEELSARIRDLQAQLDALRAEILNNCRVLATTVYRTYLKGQVERSFDAVLVDEASMLLLPMVYYAAGLAKRHVVITGDFRQLPPIVMSHDPHAEEWLRQDVFRKAGVAGAVETGQKPKSLVSLRTQYRMHLDICFVINQLFYRDRPLQTPDVIRKRAPDHFPLGTSPLLYADTGPYHPWASMRLGTYSRYNVLHAIVLRNIASHLRDAGYLPPPGPPNEALGMVSPYKFQTRLVKELLREQFGDHGVRFAATVHRFQGNEKNTIVIDLTDSFGARPSKFVKAVGRDEDGARLLNVALSRARHHVLLVANFHYLERRVSHASIVAQILKLFRNKGQALDVQDLLALGPDDWLNALAPVKAPDVQFDASKAGAFTEATFYPAFFHDLTHAAESVVIFSPFLTETGVGRWMDVLKAKVSHGTRVRLVTKPPGEQGPILEHGIEDLIDQMRASGVVVDLRAYMHEKFAIIDRDILWHGSLNILSHKRTSESMLRIPSRSACEQVGRFVSSPLTAGFAEKRAEVDLAARENPECPNCSTLMVWKNGRYGVYYECDSCGEKTNPRSRARKRGAAPGKASKKPGRKRGAAASAALSGKTCAKCGSPMVQRSGAYGAFLGCTRYPACRHTEPLP